MARVCPGPRTAPPGFLRAPLLPLLALLALAGGGGVARAEDPPAPSTQAAGAAASQALVDLESPLAVTREAAARRLARLLPAARGAVLQAVGGASPRARPHLVDVLVRDGSPEAVRTLLDTLRQGEHLEPLHLHIQRALTRDPAAAGHVLAAWAKEPALRLDPQGRTSPRVVALEDLLRRAEAERLFLERKSPTGMTGSYRGQYAVLDRPDLRKTAVGMCLAILEDREMVVPGEYAAGGFDFLRPAGRSVDFAEVRDMAANAWIDLVRAEDVEERERLLAYAEEVERELRQGPDYMARLELTGRFADLVVALYHTPGPGRHRRWATERIHDLVERQSIGLPTRSLRAMIYLRIGRYEEAVDAYLYGRGWRGEPTSRAHDHYNIACAYARWAEQSTGPEKEERLQLAIEHLEQAVENRWSDLEWMQEDRDLDAVRKAPHLRAAYEALVRRVSESITPPELRGEPAEGEGPGPGAGSPR